MSERTREEIMKKVRALLNMADPERGGSQQEIETAAKHAKRLMDEYNIEMLEVMNEVGDNPNLFVSKEATYAVAKMKAWHWSLARAIGRIVGTRHYSMGSWGHSERRKRDAKKAPNMRITYMCFFGMKANVEVACDLFDKWCHRIDQMGTEAVSEYIEELEEEFAEEMEEQGVTQIRFLKGLEDRHPQTWRTSWLDGCLNGIHSALYEEEKRREDEARVAMGRQPISHLSYREQRAVLAEEEKQEAAGALPAVTTGSPVTALALYQEKVDKAYDDFSTGFRKVRSSASSKTNYSGFERGHAVGKKIRLNSKELNG